MITKIQLQKEASVLADDGKRVGTLERVVVNPVNNVITDIVVRTGGLLNQEEKVVPVELIDETAADKILLHEKAGDLEGFPPFEERRLISEHGVRGQDAASGVKPPMGSMPVVGAPMAPVPNEQIVTRIEQNIPEGTVAMKVGAKVTSADQKHIGNVDCVVAEPFMDQITHLQVSKGLLMKETSLIPVRWVLRMGEDKVYLRVSKDSIAEVTEPPMAG